MSCIFCGVLLSKDNVFMFDKRKNHVDKCDSCTDKLESGVDMYEWVSMREVNDSNCHPTSND